MAVVELKGLVEVEMVVERRGVLLESVLEDLEEVDNILLARNHH